MEHIPVLAEPVTRFLLSNAEGIYVDATLGLGGHAMSLLDAGGEGMRVIGIDRDAAALERAKGRLSRYGSRVSYILGNFSEIGRLIGGISFNGVLADLGLSSFQISDRSRGFSYMSDGPLDMSMGGGKRSVTGLLAGADRKEIGNILREFGEVRRYRRIAGEIVAAREDKAIERTSQLREIVERAAGDRDLFGVLSRVFQAFRIWANDELDNLRIFLPQCVDLLRPGGRIAVISYHSLEDRIVKRFFRQEERGCVCPPDFPECVCNRRPSLNIITKRPVVPSEDEVAANPRSRSAKLRVAERL